MRRFFLFFLMLLSITAGAKKKDMRTKVILETTKGNITIALFDETPIHRDNFVALVKKGFYDGLLFHRVISDFMIQTGDPDSREAPFTKPLGDGGPGYTLPAEIVFPKLYHRRGMVAAARESDYENPERRSSGSQFYIVYGKTFSQSELSQIQERIYEQTDGEAELSMDQRLEYETRGGTPHLDGQYTIFGEVVDGMKVVSVIERVKTNKADRPREDIKIVKARVIESLAK